MPLKSPLWLSAFGGLVVLGVVGVLLLAFALTDPCSQDEVARTSSPSLRLDAILVEQNCGATTSFRYLIHIVPRAADRADTNLTATLYGSIRSKSAYGVNLRWSSDTVLIAEYLRATEATVLRARTLVRGEPVLTVLRDSISDPAAPSGGMLYNLERGRGQRP